MNGRGAWWAVAGFALVAALAGSTARGDVPDPIGPPDVFGDQTFDINSTAAIPNLLAGTTTFRVHFVTPITAPSLGLPDGVLGYIDIDQDKNPLTGGQAPWGGPLVGGQNWINFFNVPNPGMPTILPPNAGFYSLGDEYFVDLYSELTHPGLVDVIDTRNNGVFATVPIAYSRYELDVTVPVIGSGDGSVNYGVIVGTADGPTDIASNIVPEPASAWLLALGLPLALALARHLSRTPPADAVPT